MSIYLADTVADLLARHPADAPAILTPTYEGASRAPLTYGALRALAARTRGTLNGLGIGRNDRVAMVLPNGPEAASAWLAVATFATAAPLNPAYRAEELTFSLSDLRARALIVQKGVEGPAREVAVRLGIPVVELTPDPAVAGAFTLEAPAAPVAPRPAEENTADDIALVLHTSGTTARPKIVPLSSRNITASAWHIVNVLHLSPDDVCLNLMPMFHIHGLIATVLCSMAGGGAVCCVPGFNAFRFFAWFDEIRPTWFSAVPTIHQALLPLAPRHPDILARARVRLIRSSSSSMPPQVMHALEETFHAPMLEAYGMTEAAHQICANPPPPRPHYAGSVGPSGGPELAIMDAAGNLLPCGTTGEVVIRGRNVFAGYEANPEANARAFTNGWFRTGDVGHLDAAGYLRLSGRLKELINRGGEKISPLEVDAVLMDHPAVLQVATFAMPHEKLGEEVAAAVVLREGMTLDEATLRSFAAERLAAFKVPRRVVFLAEIPKGPTGKLQRIGLAARLGLAG